MAHGGHAYTRVKRQERCKKRQAHIYQVEYVRAEDKQQKSYYKSIQEQGIRDRGELRRKNSGVIVNSDPLV